MNNHNNRDHSRGAKRKLSCIQCDHPPRIEQSIDNAVILLVLALGSMCECRDRPVPGPVGDTLGLLDSMNQRALWLFGSNSAMPTSSSFFTTSHSHTSPSMGELLSRSGPMMHSREPTSTWNLQNTDSGPILGLWSCPTSRQLSSTISRAFRVLSLKFFVLTFAKCQLVYSSSATSIGLGISISR